ncbi:hypothetical protein C8J98_11454 [Luteibacter sp. OK325]|uniref:hypothetical protein n=1 Tax=Luteibacter sp. OK325 TaxID=2135670 RepID=UPI000D45C739|nr:hypothetical protein [Luteibacter sp. OK325]PTR23401.1 hypothetical protein C8J98_11454 [Luteibacter sp. OK325]
MTSQMSATSAAPAVQSTPPSLPGRRPRPGPARETERLLAFMTTPKGDSVELGALAPGPLDDVFLDASPGTIRAGEMLELPRMMILAASADVILEQTNKGFMVTGTLGRNNECRLIFHHAFRRVRCDVRVPNGAAESRITFLSSPRQKSPGLGELHSFNLCRPLQGLRGDAGGFSTTLDYHADPLNEVQGILWRGGLLQISRISLTP